MKAEERQALERRLALADMLELKQQSDFEDAILDLIDNRDDYTRSDLQGAVSAIVMKIQNAGTQ